MFAIGMGVGYYYVHNLNYYNNTNKMYYLHVKYLFYISATIILYCVHKKSILFYVPFYNEITCTL